MNEAKPKCSFRFGLRTLLVMVTLAAVGSWFFFSWPRWKLHLRESQFIEPIKNAKAGDMLRVVQQFIHRDPETRFLTSDSLWDIQPRRATNMWAFVFPDRIYCILMEIDGEHHNGNTNDDPLNKIELLDLALPPTDYTDQWRQGRRPVAMFEHSNSTSWPPPPSSRGTDKLSSYLGNFLYFVYGDRKDNPGYQYKVIYSDPPAKPNQ
jgi:hypothetical protein